MYGRLNTRELEIRLNELDNKLAKKIEDLREENNNKYLTKVYYDAKQDAVLDKLARYETVLKDAYTVMQEFKSHQGKVTLLEGELDKLQKAIELVDMKSETRHDKVINALEAGISKIQTQLDNRGASNMSKWLGGFSIAAIIVNMVVLFLQHYHP